MSSKIEEAAGVANKALRDFNRLTASVKTYKDAFALKKIYQGEVKKLARSGDSSSGSFRALAQGVQDLDDALENAVARQLK